MKWLSETRFALYLVLIVLLNIASSRFFFRADLTANRIFSLSDASKGIVAELQEPLTIRAFFSKDLEPPYNTIEQQLRDLLEEYAVNANRFFNYTFYDMGGEGNSGSEEIIENRDLAQSYSINPIQIQKIEQDEVKLQSAYLGVALIHGDMIETIPSLTSTNNLEYRITATIRKMIEKTDILLGLENDIEVTLVFSSNLYEVDRNMTALPANVEEMIRRLNRQYYDRVKFSHLDPTLQPELEKEIESLNLTSFTMSGTQDGREVREKAYASLIVVHENQSVTARLLERGIFGYQLADIDSIEEFVVENMEKLIGINVDIGYLADHGTPPLKSSDGAAGSLAGFRSLVSGEYTLKEVLLKAGDFPEGLNCLIIAGPTEKFSEYALYQIDQFLMKGGSLAFFIDTYREYLTQSNYQAGVPPEYIRIDSGLEKLLEHYGIKVTSSYVMDENCYIYRARDASGGIQETSYYYAPLIKEEKINRTFDILRSIKGLVVLNASPVEILSEESEDRTYTRLISSSDRSWEVSENINLYSPLLIRKPVEPEAWKSFPLAYVAEGSFTSYFQGKPIPERNIGEDDKEPDEGGENEKFISAETLEETEEFHDRTDEGQIFVIGSSAVLRLEAQDNSSNAVFILNILDYLNGQKDFAVMRGKGQRFNPLRETTPEGKSFIKAFNIAALPVIVILAGVLVWFNQLSRRRRIKEQFAIEEEER